MGSGLNLVLPLLLSFGAMIFEPLWGSVQVQFVSLGKEYASMWTGLRVFFQHMVAELLRGHRPVRRCGTHFGFASEKNFDTVLLPW